MYASKDWFLSSYPNSNHALQIVQPNWKPRTPMQHAYLSHVKDCTEKFDMEMFNNHTYWMRVEPRGRFMNGSFTRLTDGVLPPGPKLLMFATFALPVTVVADVYPLLRGWLRRFHNMFHATKYHRVVNIPKWSWNNTSTVNRMGVIWVVTRYFCRLFNLDREKSYLACMYASLFFTLPIYYRIARFTIPLTFCLMSVATYKLLGYYGHLNALGIRRGRRSREMFALKTTRHRVRTMEERYATGSPTGLLNRLYRWRKKRRLKRKRHYSKFRSKKRARAFPLRFQTTGKRNRFRNTPRHRRPWHTFRQKVNNARYDPLPDWYYGKYGHQTHRDWDAERLSVRDQAWKKLENIRNESAVRFVPPIVYDKKRRELESVEVLNELLDENFWANPNQVVHGQETHKIEHYLEKADNYFF